MKPEQPTRQLAILGLGLMGSSLGLAVRAAGTGLRVTAYARREESRLEALRRGVADAVYATPADAVEGADIVVLCTPVLDMARLLRACGKALKHGAVVTDVGSTKAELVGTLGPIAATHGADFIGSHPVCGSERTGMAAARADLYRDARVVVTARDAERVALERVDALWTGIGARVIHMTPEAHDQVFAWTSHLPHLAAAALVAAVAGLPHRADLLVGSGFRDTTRVAQGSADVWHDIVRTNADQLEKALDGYLDLIQTLRDRIRDRRFEELREFLACAARDRARFLDGN